MRRHTERPITTRRCHPGLHRVDVQITGHVAAEAASELLPRPVPAGPAARATADDSGHGRRRPSRHTDARAPASDKLSAALCHRRDGTLRRV
jgi:hypothetical protein